MFQFLRQYDQIRFLSFVLAILYALQQFYSIYYSTVIHFSVVDVVLTILKAQV